MTNDVQQMKEKKAGKRKEKNIIKQTNKGKLKDASVAYLDHETESSNTLRKKEVIRGCFYRKISIHPLVKDKLTYYR